MPQMMHKAVGRPPMSELSDRDLPHRALDGDCALQYQPRAPAGDAQSKLVDGRYMDRLKTSLVLNDDSDLKPGAAAWLTAGAIHRQQLPASFLEEERRKWCGCEDGSQCVNCSFFHLQPDHAATTATHPSDGTNAAVCTQWLPTQIGMAENAQDGAAAVASAQLVGQDVLSDSMMAISTQQPHGTADINYSSSMQGRGLLDLYSDAANSSDLVDGDAREDSNIWQTAKMKADILSHPLYEELLAAHAACLRIGTPVGQLTRIDAQLTQSQQVRTKYSVLAGHNDFLGGDEKDELDQFMTHYVILLRTFRDQLQQHVREQAMEAIMSCWELQQSLFSLTGAMPGEGTGASMSDDDDDQAESNQGIYDVGIDGGFGPLIPTETERSLMERVRQELKIELKQGYRNRIVDVRDEILRKRRAGKLPSDTTSALKAWWQSHSKWPYPTEEEKASLVQETGLQLKQINNWFINQRKRNWHNNPSTSTSLKNRRKR